jgi:hypothetical protein
MLDSMAIMLSKGQWVDLPDLLVDNMIKYPEIQMFLSRGRITVEEVGIELLEE